MTAAARLIRIIRAARAGRWVTEHSWFYNLDNYRPDAQVARELIALASSLPATIELVECIGNHLPDLPGYDLLRDLSNDSRANIAVYVRDDLPHTGPRWLDLAGRWPRTEGPGMHEPRSFLTFHLGWVRRAVAHQAPRNAVGWYQLQTEGITRLRQWMAPRGSGLRKVLARLIPRSVTWDSNARVDDGGPTPATLAGHVGGKVHGGHRVDNTVTCGGLIVTSVTPVERVGDVDLESDHRHAILIRWKVRAIWLRARRTVRR